MKTAIILSILGGLLLIGIATTGYLNGRIDTTQTIQKEDMIRVDDRQRKLIDQTARVETKVDSMQLTLDRIEKKLDD